MPKLVHGGLMKRCSCKVKQWPKCPHPWLLRFHHDGQAHWVHLHNYAQWPTGVCMSKTEALRLAERVKDEIRNAVLVDLLPGGLEVDNPRLRSRGQLGFDPPQGLSPAYQDIRDDRVLLFVDHIGGEQSFSYTVRAVTPGRFVVPNAFAEAMYDPEVRGESHEPKPLVIADNNGGK